MFKKNEKHRIESLFAIKSYLSEEKQEKLKKAKENDFFKIIFCKIKEEDFKCLYSEGASRPNAPVNTLIASIILMSHNAWTVEKMFDHIDFDLLTRTALGMDTFDDTPFCPATYFNFLNRLSKHFVTTGTNLLEKVFDSLTSEQLKTLKIRTNIQRSDSFMAMSNIANLTRAQLIIEMLIRLFRELKEGDKIIYQELLKSYTKQTSGQYMYKVERSDLPKEMSKLGEIYHKLYEELQERYLGVEIFKVFSRVYSEHFCVVSEKVAVKEPKELSASSLQSPDDLDATYRRKNWKSFKGQSVNVTETANPDNGINLIIDVAVRPNITDDSKILNERLENIKEKAPDLEELHTDGAYGSSANDAKMEELKITHVQTAIRGKKSEVEMEIEEISRNEYTVKCPFQTAIVEKTPSRNKAIFEMNICKSCEKQKICKAKEMSGYWAFYFDTNDYLLFKRNRNINKIPIERKGLRPNVEATIKEFTKPFNHKGKLKVRGLFKTAIFAYAMAISINFGRIRRHSSTFSPDLSPVFHFAKNLFDFWKFFEVNFQKLFFTNENSDNILILPVFSFQCI